MMNVIEESRRCLQCKRPSCVKGCPVGTDISLMIKLFLEGKMDEAGAMLFENNPLSVITSMVCDHMQQCEGSCILHRKQKGLHVGSVEHYISSRYLDRFRPAGITKLGKRVAVIGSGPAGMTISVILARRGYDVTIFDSREQIGGVLRYGIPEFRLPKTVLDRYQKLMESLDIKIRPNTTIGRSITVEDLFRDGYLSVFIGTGVWRPSAMKIKGESLGHVHFAIDYLTSPKTYSLGESVAVIGAGNAAMDVARTAIRQGARTVTVYARRTVLSASPTEVEFAKIDGVDFRLGFKPLEITPEGVIFHEVAYDEAGNGTDLLDTARLYPADSVIIAIGQGPKSTIVNSTQGIEVDRKGLVVANECGETTRQGVFASGDVVSGARTVVEAVRYSKDVADAMDAYMQQI